MTDRLIPHGTRSAYLAGCRCLQCRRANALRRRRCYHQAKQPPVDLGTLQEHLTALEGLGISAYRIEQLSGVTKATLRRIRAGRGTVRFTTARRLLRVLPFPAAGRGVEALPAWRVVRWLRSEGFSNRQIADLVGVRQIRLEKRYAARVVARLQALRVLCESDAWTPEHLNLLMGSFGWTSTRSGQLPHASAQAAEAE